MLEDGGGKNGRLPNRIDATKQPNRIALCSKPDFPFPANAAPLLSAIRFAGVRNGRLLDVNDGQVRFTYRDYQADGQQKEMVLPAVEFIRCFLQHVLPKQFVRVHHYGFLDPRYRAQKLARCRTLLGDTGEVLPVATDRETLLREILGHDPDRCLLCGEGRLQPYQTLHSHPNRRQWVLTVA